MGTRSAIAINFPGPDGKPLLRGSYNHYDGYPTGVGAELQRELAEVDSLASLIPQAQKMKWVDSEDRPTAAEFIDLAPRLEEVTTRANYYSLLRGHHGSLLKRLKAGVATDETGFLKESLFCEWAYLFDLIGERVYILKGFNQNARKQSRWAKSPKSWTPTYEGETRYYACSERWSGTLDEFKALDMEKLG